MDGPDKSEPVAGFIGDSIGTWTPDGLYFEGGKHKADLIEYHEPDIRTIWVNVYEDRTEAYWGKEAASSRVCAGVISIAQPVTFEVKKS